MIISATQEDPELQLVVKEIQDNGPSEASELSTFKKQGKNLSITEDGIILCKDQLVIPSKLQRQIVEIAHETHQGQKKTHLLLRESVWFAGMRDMVRDVCNTCQICQIVKDEVINHPLHMSEMPEQTFEETVDFYGPLIGDGKHIMVVNDLCSRYPETVIPCCRQTRHTGNNQDIRTIWISKETKIIQWCPIQWS